MFFFVFSRFFFFSGDGWSDAEVDQLDAWHPMPDLSIDEEDLDSQFSGVGEEDPVAQLDAEGILDVFEEYQGAGGDNVQVSFLVSLCLEEN